MKKITHGFVFLFIPVLLSVLPAKAAEITPTTSGLSMASVDKNNVEGWIIQIDYNKSLFRLLDPRGFQRIVNTKPGLIGDYRIGDKLKVEIDPERKIASRIEKIY